jgi:hypothetical protein
MIGEQAFAAKTTPDTHSIRWHTCSPGDGVRAHDYRWVRIGKTPNPLPKC